ncbi:inhibitor of apoptosis-promoting Bax1-domain-containing protein [Syncephalis fuscata]|nr:inhibitor of apoptosis-promoting Bax1-domain-containing protein [Syncephalis fuscata]
MPIDATTQPAALSNSSEQENKTSVFDFSLNHANREENIVKIDDVAKQVFVCKVYSVLAIQLLSTALVILLFTFNKHVSEWVQNSPLVLLCITILTAIVLLLLARYRRSYPINAILLCLFSVPESYVVGATATKCIPIVVLLALMITLVIFVGVFTLIMCTLFKVSHSRSIKSISILILIISYIIKLFIPALSWPLFGIITIVSIIDIVVIIKNTSEMLKELESLDIVVAVMQLYMDFIVLFLDILSELHDWFKD